MIGSGSIDFAADVTPHKATARLLYNHRVSESLFASADAWTDTLGDFGAGVKVKWNW